MCRPRGYVRGNIYVNVGGEGRAPPRVRPRVGEVLLERRERARRLTHVDRGVNRGVHIGVKRGVDRDVNTGGNRVNLEHLLGSVRVSAKYFSNAASARGAALTDVNRGVNRGVNTLYINRL